MMILSIKYGIVTSIILLANQVQGATTSRATQHTQSLKPPSATGNHRQVNKYTVTNGTGTVCIVLVADIELHIKYNATNAIQTTNVTVPGNFNTSGECSYDTDQQSLNIHFLNSTWDFSMIFKKDTKKPTENQDNEMIQYYWSEIDLNYVVTEDLFPDVLPEYIGETVNESTYFPAGLFHTSGSSYRCNGTKTVNIGDSEIGDIHIEISQLQYRAFGTSTKDDFSSTEVTECTDSPTKEVDKIPAIVIGCICLGLGVIGAIVYFLFRHRQYHAI